MAPRNNLDKPLTPVTDVEQNMTKVESQPTTPESVMEEGIIEDLVAPSSLKTFLKKLALAGVEVRGLEPIPPEKRTHTRYFNVLTLFGGSFISILPLSIGTTPTLVFGLSFSHAAAMIVSMQLIMIMPTLYILTLAPRLGMRQSVQFRYAFGKYPNALISLSTIVSIGIFGILAAVAGGECLAAVRPGTLTVEGGLSIIMAVAIVIGFFGYQCLHAICQYIWIPNLICLLILVGCAGKGLGNQAPQAASSGSAKPYLSTVTIAASNMATWGTIIGDYTCYMPPRAPRMRLVAYCLLGLYVPFSLMMVLGAALGGAVAANEGWLAAYGRGSLGGVLGEILTARVGDFGRFVLVVLGFSIVTTSARDMYSISLFIASFIPWLHRIPRVLLLLCVAGVMIGVGVAASRSFLPALTTLVSIAGYMTGPTVGVYLVEWAVFRKADPSTMDPAIWNDSRALPSGIPAIICAIVPWALIVTSMATPWYTGPIAKHTGDLAYELGALSAVLLYLPLRAAEIRYRGRL